MSTTGRPVAIAAAVSVMQCMAGCGMFDGYLREHHFENDGSTALILEAKQRVLTQRTVLPDPDFQGKVTTGIVVCSEPSPDVANALSSALSTSLNAALPTGAGAKNLSADLSMSRAESVVQLGSRIATIQLLRDELADLCRSYANGAVTATTYTLRLSRLDKKMVTLLLSEAAGRSVSTQSAIVGTGSAGTSPSASVEEVTKARQAVIDASNALVTKEKELKDAAESDKKAKQGERDAAFKALQDKQSLLLAMERRALDTTASADVQTVVLNSPATGSGQGDTLIALQDNFLLQDDLTTFLDACISSMDLLQRPLKEQDRSLLATQRAVVDKSEIAFINAQAAASSAKARYLQAQSAADKQFAESELAKAENAYQVAQEATASARQYLTELNARLQPISRFGQFCQDRGLELIVGANVSRISARRDMLDARRQLLETQVRDTALRVCDAVLKTNSLGEDAKKSCKDALAQGTRPIDEGRMTVSEVSTRTVGGVPRE